MYSPDDFIQQQREFLINMAPETNRHAVRQAILLKQTETKNPLWKEAFKRLNELEQRKAPWAWQDHTVRLLDENIPENSEAILRAVGEWRKGPLHIWNHFIDAEWRSDHKWQRLAPHIPDLTGKTVLDVGAHNMWFGYPLLAEKNAERVIGFDPIVHPWLQYLLLQKISPESRLHLELLGVEHVPFYADTFDVVMAMGILYHHRYPLKQLADLKLALKPGGTLYLETIGIPGKESYALFPPDRYARMKNVWFLPTLSCLVNMLQRVGFMDIKVISTHWGREQEQRKTNWSTGPSYLDTIHPEDQSKTEEGHPAPERFLVSAKKKEAVHGPWG